MTLLELVSDKKGLCNFGKRHGFESTAAILLEAFLSKPHLLQKYQNPFYLQSTLELEHDLKQKITCWRLHKYCLHVNQQKKHLFQKQKQKNSTYYIIRWRDKLCMVSYNISPFVSRLRLFPIEREKRFKFSIHFEWQLKCHSLIVQYCQKNAWFLCQPCACMIEFI